MILTLILDTTYQMILRNDPFDATRIQSERFQKASFIRLVIFSLVIESYLPS